MTTIARIIAHPVKGFLGVDLNKTNLKSGRPLDFDRSFAFRVNNLDKGNAWAPKNDFLCAMRYPEMAAVQATYFEGSNGFIFSQAGVQTSIDGLVDDIPLESDTISQFATDLGYEGERVELVRAPTGKAFADKEAAYVSIGNLASLKAFADASPDLNKGNLPENTDYGLCPERFGLNFWLDGAEPFVENEWVAEQSILEIGGAKLRVVAHITRCAKVDASPLTGQRDKTVCRALINHADKNGPRINGKPKPVFGVFAEVLNGDSITIGDALTFN